MTMRMILAKVRIKECPFLKTSEIEKNHMISP